jgi:hypothetical protein
MVVLTLVCFWPLVHFFFAQDDFVFLERASRGLADAAGGFFDARPGQFRPLTKGVYFALTWPLFGLHATPFHIISILLHAANALLLGAFLRRLGINSAVSRFVAVLFAVTVAYMETVAWVSCVQQLLGMLFLLIALNHGLDAMTRGAQRARVIAAVAFAAALASYEQTLAMPAVLLGAFALRHGLRASIAGARRVWELAAMLVVYLFFVLGVRGVPADGPYVMSVGPHVLQNLREYVGVTYGLWMVFPAYGLPVGFTASHGVLLACTAWLTIRQRLADLAFGMGTFLVLLAPVLFVKDHTHSFHVYLPAIGAWYLVAAVVDDALSRVRARDARVLAASLAIAGLSCGVVSSVKLRENVHTLLNDGYPLPRSFVLRRAGLAERLRDGILQKSRLRGRPGRLVMLYLHPEYAANWRNVHAALGQGSAVRLFLESPDLDVLFVPPADLPPPGDHDLEVLVYTEVGRVYTAAEVEEAQRRRAAESAPAPVDSTGTRPAPGG